MRCPLCERVLWVLVTCCFRFSLLSQISVDEAAIAEQKIGADYFWVHTCMKVILFILQAANVGYVL